jgi:hypothetical protein
MMKLIACHCVLLLLITGCRPKTLASLVIEYTKIFDSIPSASGLAIKRDTAFIVSDDGTGIYGVDLRNYGSKKIPINGFNYLLYREPKSVKHDFEAACFVTWKKKEYLIAIGSGSATSRDSLLMLNSDDLSEQRILPLNQFYTQLQQQTRTIKEQWNIEGLTETGDELIFLNRGNNLLIRCDVEAFFSWLFDQDLSFPKIDYHQLHLPSIKNREARLSGVCTIDNDNLLFCASVEDTPDWTKDGPVLGSYFGIYSIKRKKVIGTYLLADTQNKPMKQKMESVDILKTDGNSIYLLAIGDNDDGKSSLFRLKLN